MDRTGALDLLKEVEDTLQNLQKTQIIPPVKVKGMLEHLRSSLEYLASDTFDAHFPDFKGKRPRTHFPYQFPDRIDSFFTKTLNIRPPEKSPMLQVFHSIQDYSTGENWLNMMCNLTNEVKHRNPISLKNEEVVVQSALNIMGMNMVVFNGEMPNIPITIKNVSVNGIKAPDVVLRDGKFIQGGDDPLVNIKITKENKIKFHGQEIEVIPYIQLCLDKLRKFINYAYDTLEKLN
ncbi:MULTISPECIES: hypothetical protein [Enterobacter cloacae complex]|uniref:Uncharacterized protein n=1 Tax=Enterobacter cloacae TaxID=550 RepID=A0AA42QZV9_ENTCL|nr:MULTISPECIES: hypothetical protein [Enterobacter cloacae complex]ELC6294355.1 hypothetical protein [Enterobacter hormaechei]ELC6544900.1 hypothetical protein [Enterobacter hormaechei]MDH0437487.1 hypothetical protein [Enterobacter cloacae]MDH1480851.1 hypothetical protein [Enterobacter cloacae]HAS1056842.1 hypothetical protein [Enterobacter cloacae]